MRKMIKINTRPSKENLVGRSHWWGAPDLPADMPYPFVTVGDDDDDASYPAALTFICQIRLSDIAPPDH